MLGAAGRLRSHTLSTTAPRLGKVCGDTPRTLAVGAAAGRGLLGGCRGAVYGWWQSLGTGLQLQLPGCSQRGVRGDGSRGKWR